MDRKNYIRYFSGDIGNALSECSLDIMEIRLRAGRPLSAVLSSRSVFICANGAVTERPERAVKVTMEDIRRCFEAICRFSVHSCQGQISRGFVTVAGGHRAGLCGTAVYSSEEKVDNIKFINGINFRIAHEIKGAADAVMRKIDDEGLKSILICGEPCSGKTTVLRDLCRQVGNRYPVSLIDERCEIAAVSGGTAYNDVGSFTDVFSGFSKHDGIMTAVRVMSPRMVICDEIGSREDAEAIRTAAVSGVKTAATVHCGSYSELTARAEIKELITDGLFDHAVFVKGGKITDIIACSGKV